MFQDYLLCSVIRKLLPQMSYLCFWGKNCLNVLESIEHFCFTLCQSGWERSYFVLYAHTA